MTIANFLININSATDLTMKEMQNSRERELGDWKELFSAADPRFKFQAATQPAGSNLWIMVVEWQGAALE